MSDSSSGGLDAESVAALRADLTVLLQARVFPVVVETGLFAIFTVLVCTSTFIFWKRGLRGSWPNTIMVSATLAMYALSTLDWAIDIRLLWNDLRSLTVYGLPVPQTPFGFSSPALSLLQGITSVICIIIGDSVVCWRVCVVWGNNRRVNIVALFWVIGSFGVFTAFSIMLEGLLFQPAPPAVQKLVDNAAIVNAFSFSWSAATNVWATAMVAYKAWLQRQDFRRYMRSGSNTPVQKVLMMLVDLGVIYTLFMLLNVIVLIPGLEGGTFFSYVTLFMQQITGMYPTALIVFVALQKSNLEHRFTYPTTPADATLPFSAVRPSGTFATDMSISTRSGPRRPSGHQPQFIGLNVFPLSASTSGMEDSEYSTTWDKETQQSHGTRIGLAE